MPTLNIVSIDRPDPKLYFGDPELGFLDWDTLLWRFAVERSYWLATAGATPHAMPVWGVWQDCAFRFSTYPGSRKALNLREHPHASVHLGNTEAVLVMECEAREIVTTQELQQFVDEYNPKYKWNFTVKDVAQGTFALTPTKAFAWAGGEGDAFANTATRWTFKVTP